MKRYSLTTMIIFFLLLIGLTEIRAQEEFKEEELMKALHEKNCNSAINLAKLIQSPDYTDDDGLSLLMSAAASKCPEVVKMLLIKGANINLQMKEIGATALIAASMIGDYETVKLLLEKGAKVDFKLVDGQTALMLASKHGYPEVVKLLLLYGENVELRTKDSGQTALSQPFTNGNSLTTSSTSQADSLSQVLLTRVEKLIEPIPLKVIFWCDSVPSSYQMLGKISFVDAFSGFREDAKGNSRMGFTKSKFSDFNIFFFAKISEQVEIYTIKPDMTFLDFSYLDEIPNKELNPTKILTLKTLSKNNIVRYNEIIFHSTNERFKFIDNKWIKVE